MTEKVQSNNFINIQGWMVKELQLKNNELLVFAIIYGFSQDGSSYFSGSSSYLAEWCNCDKRSVFNILKKLVEKNLIIRHEKVINNVKLVDYSVNQEAVHDMKNFHKGNEKSSQGVVKNFHKGNEKSSYHNIEDNNNIDNKKDIYMCEPEKNELEIVEEPVLFEEEKDTFIELAEGIKYIVENKKRIKVNAIQLKQWAIEIKSLFNQIKELRGDNQALTDIKTAIQFLLDHTGEEYIPVVESGKSFKEKFGKIEAAIKRNKKDDFTMVDFESLGW